MTATLKALGKRIAVDLVGTNEIFYVDPTDIGMVFDSATNNIALHFVCQNVGYDFTFPMASVTMAGTVITSQSVFETQLGVLFPNTNSGSGGSGSASIQTDDTAAFATLTNGTYAYYEVSGTISFYGKTSTGTEQKLTIPNF
jgi:hypothetical protein